MRVRSSRCDGKECNGGYRLIRIAVVWLENQLEIMVVVLGCIHGLMDLVVARIRCTARGKFDDGCDQR